MNGEIKRRFVEFHPNQVAAPALSSLSRRRRSHVLGTRAFLIAAPGEGGACDASPARTSARSPNTSSVAAVYGRRILAVHPRSVFDGPVKPIHLSDHALRYMSKRGFTIAEVEEAIRTVPWQRTDLGRLDCRKDFPYGKEWNGKTYATKQVRPVFVEEAGKSQLLQSILMRTCCRDCLHILFLNS